MAENSSMIPLGTKAPSFTLLDTVSNRFVTLEETASPVATVIMFICNHCPYVKLIQKKMVEIASTYQAKGVKFIAISSNDAVNYPDDSPDKMHDEAVDHHYPFPYLYDENQDVARAYRAACTPDLFIFDNDLLCVYRGRFDDATPKNGVTVSGRDLTNALDCILSGKPVDHDQKSSIGCGIKWKRSI